MPYVELHCHSTFSFLDGASHPIELAGAAAEQGHAALALTDHDGLYGAMELAQAARPLGIRPLTGAELTLDDGSHLTLLCETAAGYHNLCLLITESHRGTREWSASGTPNPATQPTVALEHVERQDAFVAVRLGTTLDESEPARRGNSSHVLAPPEAMAERFADHPDAVHESGRIAERLAFDLTSDLGYQYPGAEDPDADRKLAEICRAVIDERYGGRATRAK